MQAILVIFGIAIVGLIPVTLALYYEDFLVYLKPMAIIVIAILAATLYDNNKATKALIKGKKEKYEREVQERKLLNVLDVRLEDMAHRMIIGSNYFQKFVAGLFKKFTNDYGEWPEPREYNLSDQILEPFQLILEDEYDDILPLTNIRKCVGDRLEILRQTLFNESFDSIINSREECSGEGFLENAVSVYCDVFGEDASFFCDLETYVNGKTNQYNGDENLSLYLRNTLDNEIERRKKKQRIETIKQKLDAGIGVVEAVTISQIDVLKGLEFEKIVGALYENMGYKATVTKGSGDQGGDVVVEKYGLRTVVQAKRYDGSVGNKAVQEAVASKAYYDCEEAIVITNNHFTNAARVLADVNNVKLIEREELISLLEKYPIVQ